MTVRARLCAAHNPWMGATCIVDPSRHRGSHCVPDSTGRYREWPQLMGDASTRKGEGSIKSTAAPESLTFADRAVPPRAGQPGAGGGLPPAPTVARDDSQPQAAADGARGAGVTADCASRSPIEVAP